MDNLINLHNIELCEDVPDWEYAVRRVGALLVRSGSVTSGYVDGMVDMIHELGPYIVIIPQVAIAHARPSEQVLKDDMALLIIRRGVAFGSANDPVVLLFCLSSADGQSHLEALKRLVEFFKDEEPAERLKQCCDAAQAWKIINQVGKEVY